MAYAGGAERGAVYTRREVVDFILDLVGYTDDQPLHTFRLLEPSFGEGDFLVPVVERLVRASLAESEPDDRMVNLLKGALRAVELHRYSFDQVRFKI